MKSLAKSMLGARRLLSSIPSLGGRQPRILVTGALGQIGTELVPAFRHRYGALNVISSDIRAPPACTSSAQHNSCGPFEFVDVEHFNSIASVVVKYGVNCVVHLSSMLSAVGEKNPQLAQRLNCRGVENVLELSRLHGLLVFAPSTIAAFGPTTPAVNTPETTIMRPTTIYGVTKVYLELLGEYYHRKFGVDFRSLRYPGIISNQGLPGGGTTDYAVEIYHEAVKRGRYTCFLSADTALPMMYMPDCISSTIAILEAPQSALSQRVYNITGCSFTPRQAVDSIKKSMPGFTAQYKPDFRQAIADSWPRSLNCERACRDLAWQPAFDLDRITEDMLNALRPRYPSSNSSAAANHP